MKERLGSRYYHFSNLLGGELSADSEDDNVKQIFQNLPIDDSPYSKDRYKAARKNTKTGKAAGLDGIPREALKYCDLDEIFLQFANKLLTKPYLFVIVLDYELRMAIEGREECLGLTIKPRQRRNVKAEKKGH